MGAENRAIAVFEDWIAEFADEYEKRQVMESIGWGILRKSSESNQYSIRMTSMVGGISYS